MEKLWKFQGISMWDKSPMQIQNPLLFSISIKTVINSAILSTCTFPESLKTMDMSNLSKLYRLNVLKTSQMSVAPASLSIRPENLFHISPMLTKWWKITSRTLNICWQPKGFIPYDLHSWCDLILISIIQSLFFLNLFLGFDLFRPFIDCISEDRLHFFITLDINL